MHGYLVFFRSFVLLFLFGCGSGGFGGAGVTIGVVFREMIFIATFSSSY